MSLYQDICQAIELRDAQLLSRLLEGIELSQALVQTLTRQLKPAIRNRSFDVARVLLENGADVNSSGAMTPVLYGAVESGHQDAVLFAMSAGAALDAVHGVTGNTALHLAASSGEVDIVRILLNGGVNPNLVSFSGSTPLSLACVSGDDEVVELLLAAGADPNLFGGNASSALYLVAPYPDLVERLLEVGADPSYVHPLNGLSVLHAAARAGNDESIALLVERGVDVDIKDNAGRTPLFFAASETQSGAAASKVFDALLAAGADPWVGCVGTSGETLSSRRKINVLDEILAHRTLPFSLHMALSVYRREGWDSKFKYGGKTLKQWFVNHPSKHLISGLVSHEVAQRIESEFSDSPPPSVSLVNSSRRGLSL